MCGGIAFQFSRIPKRELEKYYTSEEIGQFESKGELESFYWSKIPLLPVEIEGEIVIRQWGNRDKELKLPKTGWAKVESLEEGKWSYLHPEYVKIAADRGFEKGKWFDIKSGGLQGIAVLKDKEERVYMVTKPSDEEYLKLTKHDRQPVEIE